MPRQRAARRARIRRFAESPSSSGQPHCGHARDRRGLGRAPRAPRSIDGADAADAAGPIAARGSGLARRWAAVGAAAARALLPAPRRRPCARARRCSRTWRADRAGPGLVGLRQLGVGLPAARLAAAAAEDADAAGLRRCAPGAPVRAAGGPAPGDGDLQFRNARTGSETLAVPIDDAARRPATRSSAWPPTAAAIRALRAATGATCCAPQPDDDEADVTADSDSSGGRRRQRRPGAGGLGRRATRGLGARRSTPDEDLALGAARAAAARRPARGAVARTCCRCAASRCSALLLRLQRRWDWSSAATEDRWAVATLSYAMVRRWLRGRDYLIDDF